MNEFGRFWFNSLENIALISMILACIYCIIGIILLLRNYALAKPCFVEHDEVFNAAMTIRIIMICVMYIEDKLFPGRQEWVNAGDRKIIAKNAHGLDARGIALDGGIILAIPLVIALVWPIAALILIAFIPLKLMHDRNVEKQKFYNVLKNGKDSEEHS